MNGLIHSRSVLMDAPANYAGYAPLNEDRRFMGPVDATDALNLSRNIPAIDLAKALHPDLYDFLKAMDVPLKKSREDVGLSIVLGGAEVPMNKLAAAYATLLSQGVYSSLAWTDDAVRDVRPLFSPEAAAVTREMLKTGGTRVTVNGVSLPLAWKTGTSNGYRDAWTAGFAGPYVVAVWTGNFSGRASEKLRGADAALPLWKTIAMRTLTEPTLAVTPEEAAQNPVWDAMPAGVTKEDVCRRTGDLARDNFGRTRCEETRPAWFIPGKSPIKPSGYLKEIRVDAVTGLRSCPAFQGETTVKFVEVWPEQWAGLLKENGILYRPLPPLHPDCLKADDAASRPVTLVSPSPRRVWVADPVTKMARVTLNARLPRDAGPRTLYWFAEGEWIAATRSGESVEWVTTPGDKTLTVTDDEGNSASVRVTVKR